MADQADTNESAAILGVLKDAIWEMNPDALDLSKNEDLTHVVLFGPLDLMALGRSISDAFPEIGARGPAP